jgi:hypothetical protein
MIDEPSGGISFDTGNSGGGHIEPHFLVLGIVATWGIYHDRPICNDEPLTLSARENGMSRRLR